MSLSDPIGDMIARVKNAQARNHKKVDLPSSNFKTKIADILKNEGFIKDFKIKSENVKMTLSLELKYHAGNPVISAFERVSKPGRRIFSSAESLPKVNNGLGIAIISTPKGFDKFGNYTFGIKEHIIFPEVNFDRIDRIRGLDVVVVIAAMNKDHSFALLEKLNFPFIKKGDN